jgi:hypothetical protein
MKKTLISIIVAFALAFMVLANFTGCASFQSQPAQNIALQIVAQRIGYYVGKNNASVVPQAKLIAQGVLASQDADATKIALAMAIGTLARQFPTDPLLGSDIELIVNGLGIRVPSSKIDLAVVTPLINAFISGMDISAGSK